MQPKPSLNIREILSRIPKTLIITILIAWAFIEAFPILYMFLSAFKTDKEILNQPFALPQSFNISNFISVWIGERSGQPFLIFFKNSVYVTFLALILLILIASLSGYALARGKFRGNSIAQRFILLTMAVPIQVLLIPMYFLIGRLGLRNNLWGLIIIYATFGLPFTIILMRAYFLSFPHELEEAAMIDGCSRLGAFIRIVLPMSKGALASMAIINITGLWSELFFALLLISKPEIRTIPLQIAMYKPVQEQAVSATFYGEQMAVLALATLPLMIYYFLFQRQIIKGMTVGAFR